MITLLLLAAYAVAPSKSIHPKVSAVGKMLKKIRPNAASSLLQRGSILRLDGPMDPRVHEDDRMVKKVRSTIEDPETSGADALSEAVRLEQSAPDLMDHIIPALSTKIVAPNTSGTDALLLVQFLEQTKAQVNGPEVLDNLILKLITIQDVGESNAIKAFLETQLKALPPERLINMVFKIIDALQSAHAGQASEQEPTVPEAPEQI